MPDRTTLFLDTEFTSLTQAARLISLALVAADGREFYAEFADLDPAAADPWVRTHVLPLTRWLANAEAHPGDWQEGPTRMVYGPQPAVAAALGDWLAHWSRVTIWGDCLAYDWVLFCELFGGARALPEPVSYLPLDLVTLLALRGLDPDTDRAALAGLSDAAARRHDALWDARVLRACHARLWSAP